MTTQEPMSNTILTI